MQKIRSWFKFDAMTEGGDLFESFRTQSMRFILRAIQIISFLSLVTQVSFGGIKSNPLQSPALWALSIFFFSTFVVQREMKQRRTERAMKIFITTLGVVVLIFIQFIAKKGSPAVPGAAILIISLGSIYWSRRTLPVLLVVWIGILVLQASLLGGVSLFTLSDILFLYVLSAILGFAVRWLIEGYRARMKEALLKEAERAARAELAAHSLRNLMSRLGHGVKARLEGLVGSLEAYAEDANKGKVSPMKALENLELAEAILSQLVAFLERAYGGRVEVKLEGLNIQELKEKTLRVYGDVAKNRGVKIVFTSTIDKVLTVPLILIEEVIYNLVNNSVKYSLPSGGEVNVTLGTDGETFVLKVGDKGRGLTVQEIEKLITNRAAESVKLVDSAEGSTGFGLRDVLSATAELKGTLEVTSPVRSTRDIWKGLGTEVVWRIPLPPQTK